MSEGTEHVGYITLPVYVLKPDHFTGLHQEVLAAGPHSVISEAGLGGPSQWAVIEAPDGKRRYYAIMAQDQLAATMTMVQHPDADRIPTSKNYGGKQ